MTPPTTSLTLTRRLRLGAQGLLTPLGTMVAAFFAFTWTQLEALGAQGSFVTWALLTLSSIAVGLLVDVVKLRFWRIPRLVLQVEANAAEGCCVTRERTNQCPLGVVALHGETQDTLRNSIEATQRSFQWLGLSSFNVVHRNMDLFREMHGKEMRFLLVDDARNSDLDQHDATRPNDTTAMSSKEHVERGVEQLRRLQDELGNRAQFAIRRYDQVHAFRIVLVDDETAYVSFYETGTDALRSPQLVIHDDPNQPANIYKWFSQYVDRIDRYVSRDD